MDGLKSESPNKLTVSLIKININVKNKYIINFI